MSVIWCGKGEEQASCAARAAAAQREYWLQDWGSLHAAMHTAVNKPVPLFCCLMALVFLGACLFSLRPQPHRPALKVPVTYALMSVFTLCMAPAIGYF